MLAYLKYSNTYRLLGRFEMNKHQNNGNVEHRQRQVVKIDKNKKCSRLWENKRRNESNFDAKEN